MVVRAWQSTDVASKLKQRRVTTRSNFLPLGQRISGAFSLAKNSSVTISAGRTADLRQGLHALAKVITSGRLVV